MATTPRGFRDILPDEAEMREHIVATVKARLVHHGYRPIETPLIESVSVGGANAWSSDAPFNLFDDNGALLAVRPDNTTSVVHAIAARMSERDLPLRLRYEAPVVRQQPRGTAQARQFTQLGYELVGEGGDAADAEMTLIAAEALDDLGLNSWQLVCGSVVPYQALLELGVDEALANEALALVHANNYIDLDELAVTSDLPVALQCAMRELPRITGGPEALDRVDALLRAAGSTTSTTTELRSLVQRLTSCNAELASHLSFDFSLMSSFGYYTGLVLKAYAGDLADPVGSGGRYDAVLDAALEQGAAAAGFAFSLERLTEVLEAQAEQAPCGDIRVGESAGTVRPGSAATTNPSASATVGEQAPLRIAVPKGSLKDDTIAALEAVGIDASGLRDPGRHLTHTHARYARGRGRDRSGRARHRARHRCPRLRRARRDRLWHLRTRLAHRGGSRPAATRRFGVWNLPIHRSRTSRTCRGDQALLCPTRMPARGDQVPAHRKRLVRGARRECRGGGLAR